MSSIIKPEQIESKLMSKWEELAKENKVRACLFNLIVFNRYSDRIEYAKARTDYIRNIVQKLVEKFPCRILFISEDPTSKKDEIKVAVDVIQQGPESACDLIDIGVCGSEVARIPFIILPHILPDLPVTLLWSEDPSNTHLLWDPLLKLSNRVIFDSECAESLQAFAKTVLDIKKSYKVDVADLNWARTEGWRDLICSLFDSEERLNQLKTLQSVEIQHNAKPTDYYCHMKVQSLYLTAWLGTRLGWKIKQKKNFEFAFDSAMVKIVETHWERLGPGTISAVKLMAKGEYFYDCEREKDRYHYVKINISSPEQCELPYLVLLGQTATGHSLVQEIIRKGTSSHYLETLQFIQGQL